MALGGSWAPTGLQEASREAPKTLPEAPGAEKKLIVIFRGASGEISQRDFTLPGGPGERFGLHFGSPWGSFWPSVWRSVWKMLKSQFLQTVHTKTLIFRLPGASRGAFGAKNHPKNKLEAKTARTHVPEPPKSLPERSRRASGAEKQTLVTSKSGQEEFWGDFSRKTPPEESGDRPSRPPERSKESYLEIRV